MAISRARRAALERDEKTEVQYDDSSGSIYNFKKLKQDKIRLVPIKLTEDEDGPKLVKVIGTHFFGGKGYTCPRVTFKEECPICQLVGELRNSGKAEERELADNISVRRRYAYRVISRNDQADNNNVPSKVFIMQAPKAIHTEIWKALTGRDPDDDEAPVDWDEAIEPDHALRGHDFTIRKKGSGMMGTKYFCSISTKQSKLHPSKEVRTRLKKEAGKIDLEDFARRDQDLDAVVEAIINGETGDEKKRGKKKRRDEDDDLDDLSARRRKKKGKKSSKSKSLKKGEKGKKKRKGTMKGTMDELKKKMKRRKK